MQADQKFHDLILEQPWQPVFSRSTDLADSIMTAIVLAPFAPAATLFIDLGRLRVQECERVEALRTELTKCGAHVEEIGDSLRIDPGPLHGAEIETYDDHRIAMCFGMLGLRVPGIRLRNPACVRKTFPNFFAKLAELGVAIQHASVGGRLFGDDLLA
jgi:3-phosphoshikimate 1-carboxyvinyltransferase